MRQGDLCVFQTIEGDDHLFGRVEVIIHTKGKTNQRFVEEWNWVQADENCDVSPLCTWYNIQQTTVISNWYTRTDSYDK